MDGNLTDKGVNVIRTRARIAPREPRLHLNTPSGRCMDTSAETVEHNSYDNAVARLESCRRRYDEYLALMNEQREAIGRGEREQLHSARAAMDRISSQLHAEMADMESIRRYISGATFDPARRTRLRRLVCEVAVQAETARKGVADLNQLLAGGQTVPPREGDEIVVAA